MFRYFLCLLGVSLAIPLLGIMVLVFTLPITISGIGYLLGGLLISIGLILAPRIVKYYFVVLIGTLVIVLIAGTRLYLIKEANSGVQMLALPEAKPASWINALVDEQDILIFGEALFHQIGGDSNYEHAGLTSSLAEDYSAMHKAGIFASPIVSTYLNLQQPDNFDAVIIKPTTNQTPRFGLVFLHGYMGNVAAQCWEIAQAVKSLGGVTICPSTEWTGQWWQPNGQAILRTTFEYVRAQGIQKIYLGGFSNGGFSIGHLSAQLRNEPGLSGLIFIDGIYDARGLQETGLPVLIMEGLQDERVPPEFVRPIAGQIGASVTYVEMDGDHFLIMKHPATVQEAIANWLEQVEKK